MGDLTNNLSRAEFACQCGCGLNTIDFELVKWIQDAADYLINSTGRPISIKITSGNRCKIHNKAIGGSPSSLHIKCRAADHKFYYKDNNEQVPPETVAELYEARHPECGIGRYDNRTHLDSRGYKSRWTG